MILVLTQQYQIMGVRDTVINCGTGKIVGAVLEIQLVMEIKNLMLRAAQV